MLKIDPNEDMYCRQLGPMVDDLHDKYVRMVVENERPDDMNVREP